MVCYDTIMVDASTYLLEWGFFERTLHAAFQNLHIRPYEEHWKVTLHMKDGKKFTTNHYERWDGRYTPAWWNTRGGWITDCARVGHYQYTDAKGVEHCIPLGAVKEVTWRKV